MDNDIDVEQLVDNIENTGEADPAPKEEITEETAKLIFDNPDSLMSHKLEYTANGKQVSEDIATILKRASQGYNYAQQVNALKDQQTEIERAKQEAQSVQEKWSKFESYAKENPKWYDHWTTAWESRDSNPQGMGQADGDGGEIDSRLTALLDQKLGPIQEFMNSQQKAKADADMQASDKQLDEAIKSTRSEFSDIDFDASDPESGKTLEYQVLEYASQNGITDFNAAFKVFYHDKLVASQVEAKKAEWAKEEESKRRQGILGEMPVSKKDPSKPDFSKSSYDQIAEFAAKDLGLA